MNRRNYLALMGAAAGALAASKLVSAQEPKAADAGAPTTSTVEDRARRMKWGHEAKFGMFIHRGLLQRAWPPRMGDGERRHPGEGVRAVRRPLQAEARRCARLGQSRQTRRHEIHGDDHQAS